MKKQILWLRVSWLVVAALVLASCAPAVTGEQEEEEEEIPTLSIGETLQTEKVAVTISELIITESYEYYHEASDSMLSKEASPGMFFIMVTVAIKNVNDTGSRLGSKLVRIFDSEDNRYLPGSYLGEDGLSKVYVWLLPGEEIKGKVLYDIPEEASGLKITYQDATLEIKLAEWEIE